MISILFVCHGNICRSPMAEFIFKDMVAKQGVADRFEIASAATSQEELGNGVYPPVKAILTSLNIDCSKKRARQITHEDFNHYDYIIVMDDYNIENLNYRFNKEEMQKVTKLKQYCPNVRDEDSDIVDPWYTRDFKSCLTEVSAGCKALLEKLLQNN